MKILQSKQASKECSFLLLMSAIRHPAFNQSLFASVYKSVYYSLLCANLGSRIISMAIN
jgi:hypothetical protein